MKIKGTPEEIAALVCAAQGRQEVDFGIQSFVNLLQPQLQEEVSRPGRLCILWIP